MLTSSKDKPPNLGVGVGGWQGVGGGVAGDGGGGVAGGGERAVDGGPEGKQPRLTAGCL